MSAENPRYFKWYPTEVTDLGTMPFEGDFTTNDRIVQTDASGMHTIYVSNASGTEFGRYVAQKVNGRIKNVWTAGVTVSPMEINGVNYPVWIIYCGDGVCALKVPAEIEEVTP